MIPTINIVAVIHLSLIMVFIGMYLAEAILELLAYLNPEDSTLHGGVIKLHFWIDLLVELPVMFGVIVTGIIMATLVDSLTTLHIIKICCVGMFLLIAVFCPLTVIKRYNMLKSGGSEESLRAASKRILNLAGVSMTLFFTSAFAIGLWLAYNRVLKSIYS
jgi:hypothetical protein